MVSAVIARCTTCTSWIRPSLDKGRICRTVVAKNVSARLREGWEFVRGDEYPDTEWPQIDSGKYNGVIAVGGLMLARIPKETVAERKKYFAQVTQDKDDAIANDPLKDQHPSMPISKERSTRVSFGGKRNT